MPDTLQWSWVGLLALGAYHGINPGMGWLFAVALGMQTGNVRGVFVAQRVKPQARVLAEARGLRWIEVDYDDLRGMAPSDLRLF